ncbi:hypothetical protein NC653_029398 [Populus alba x Populus x berolinensis]|uniref:Uncharacterized protein n=1 Tax=Populus alba x Populus x berolinensis TaxID=444605 RepID=A0AAD6M4R8_9ROSI|nr:hypothetical protein NC653_029398 [Populus alba x Populus x berolinensis]
MLEDPETVLEDPGTVAVSLPLSSRADGLFLPSTPYGWPSSVGLAVSGDHEGEIEGRLVWFAWTKQQKKKGGRYGLWVWLSVVKKDKRFLKGEGYVARRRKVQRLCWLCQWAERCGHQFWKRGDEK